ncbi:hypothetical protein M3J09_009125 [Ascochyta lentis]
MFVSVRSSPWPFPSSPSVTVFLPSHLLYASLVYASGGDFICPWLVLVQLCMLLASSQRVSPHFPRVSGGSAPCIVIISHCHPGLSGYKYCNSEVGRDNGRHCAISLAWLVLLSCETCQLPSRYPA